MHTIPYRLYQAWMRFWRAFEMQLEEDLTEEMVYNTITSQWILIQTDLKHKLLTSYSLQTDGSISGAALYSHLNKLEAAGRIEIRRIPVHPTTKRLKSQCRRTGGGNGTPQTQSDCNGLTTA